MCTIPQLLTAKPAYSVPLQYCVCACGIDRVMTPLTRRQFGAGILLGSQASRLFAKSGSTTAIDRVLDEGIERRKIPCVAAMVASADKILYSGAFGKRDSASGIGIQPDSIFAIASMTKAITSVAAMQLVERGRLKLDDPVARP